MEQKRKFISVHMYLQPDKPEIEEGVSSDDTFFGWSDSVGDSYLVRTSKRNQWRDSRLHVPRRNTLPLLLLFSNTVGCMIYAAAIWCNISNWKSSVLFVLAIL